MTIFRRLMQQFRRAPAHRSVLVMLAGVYLASVAVFSLAGEENLSDPFTALWWMVVTGSTVGYGDFSPQTTLGQAWSVLVILFTVGTVAALITELSDYTYRQQMRATKGLSSYDSLTGHTVILGYQKGFTDDLVAQIKSDAAWEGEELVLCDDDHSENPLPDECLFVRGDITTADVAWRSGLTAASHIIACADEDHETMLAAMVAARKNEDGRIIAYAQSKKARETLGEIGEERITVVVPTGQYAVVQELQDAGSSVIITDIADNEGKAVFRVALSEGGFSENGRAPTIAEVRNRLPQQGALLLGVEQGGRRILAPSGDLELRPGRDAAFVIADARPSLS